jgi:hypothetical protein
VLFELLFLEVVSEESFADLVFEGVGVGLGVGVARGVGVLVTITVTTGVGTISVDNLFEEVFCPSKIPKTKTNPAPSTAEIIIQGFFIS